jgi:hypothetical protein
MSVSDRYSFFRDAIERANEEIFHTASSREISDIPNLVFLASHSLMLRKRHINESDFLFLVRQSVRIATCKPYSDLHISYAVALAVSDLTQEDDFSISEVN